MAVGLDASSLSSLRDFLRQHTDTALAECAVAAAFLWPRNGFPAHWRDATLLFFCTTVYAVATVEGFAWILLAMGLAQSEPSRTRIRAAYLGVFFLIFLYRGSSYSPRARRPATVLADPR